MRKILSPNPREAWLFAMLAVSCAVWIVITDAYLIIPVAGLTGGLLAKFSCERKVLSGSIERKIISELPVWLKHHGSLTSTEVSAFAGNIARLIKDGDD